MAILDFPPSPAIGTLYPNPAVQGQPQYTYDGEKWISGTGGGAIYISDSAPAAPVGSLWWESDTSILYVRYFDGDSTQWCQVLNGPADAVRFGTAQTLTTAQQDQARTNIGVLPSENILINGFMDVSQEYGGASVSISAAAAYPVDQWSIGGPGGKAFTAQQYGVGTAIPGVDKSIGITSPAGYALVAADLMYTIQYMEGYRFARLGWGQGAGTGQSLAMGFWVYCSTAGTFSVAIRNFDYTRSYCIPVTVPAGVWTYRTVVFPPCPDGVWKIDNTHAANILFTWNRSTGMITPVSNMWRAENNTVAFEATNTIASGNQGCYITGVTAVAGNVPVTQAQCPLMRRGYAEELPLCQRYWRKNVSSPVGWTATNTNARAAMALSPPMRTTPTAILLSGASVIELYGSAILNISALLAFASFSTGTGLHFNMTTAAAAAYAPGILAGDSISLNARLV